MACLVNEDLSLYEVMVVVREDALRKDVDLRFNTLATSPAAALDKVKTHLRDRNHFALRIAADFVVHKPPFIE
jgi:hypothetical protein